ncbi:hypothetical protein [Methylocystis echinoides]|uniref:Uncharacterized protein n=1 Tax=Methylocystis echinoides TaxID=29468 RepID=A0A9W6GWM3_9HYPH|nr:hypothetical protein [Methylocystis echinoides]GLI94394.1 hypothetical protein LMG27198_33860 [Methylocystis echinoides]
MNLHAPEGMTPFYPQVANHIEDDPTPKDQAIYVPSVSPGFAVDVYAGQWKRPLPQGVSAEDLNFLKPDNGLFRISHAMSSAGQALNQTKPCIISQRDWTKTIIIGDSGGYQIASGRLRISGDRDRHKILNWLERTADISMTLDVPTGPCQKPGYAFKNTKDCLATTLDHLDFFQKYRTPGKIRFLNVLQGNTQKEADAWYDAVKIYDFEGWAFAGVLRHNFSCLCRRIIVMAAEGQLQNKTWIHVLGTNELETAVLLTALQRSINRHINPDLRISYDTSSPFRLLTWKTIYSHPNFSATRMSMATDTIPTGHELIGSPIRFPWPSPLGDRMTLGDIVIKPGSNGLYQDNQSYHMLVHHNLASLCYAVAMANRVYDSESIQHKHTLATTAGDAVEEIEKVIASGSMTALAKASRVFQSLRHGIAPTADDEERDF